MKTVVGVFRDANEAQTTLDELVQSGFGLADISIATGPGMRGALRIGLSSLDAIDTGRISVRGPLADALAKQAAPALSASLRSFGLPSDLADHYTRAVKQGEALESLVVDDSDADRAAAIMERHAALHGDAARATATQTAATHMTHKAPIAGAAAMGAAAGITETAKNAVAAAGSKASDATMRITGKGEQTASASGTGAPVHRTGAPGHFETRDDDEPRIPMLREEIHVGKREVERAHVHVAVRVAETPVSEHIMLREQRVEVERRPANRTLRPDEAAFAAQEFDITEYGEEPVVSKEVRVVEEVVLHTRVDGRDQVINDKIRNTYVEVAEDKFDRTFYQKHFDTLGTKGRFEEHLPAYELGESLRGQGIGSWDEAEASARAKWEATRPGTWDRVKDSVKYAWSRGR
jgi:stress response protein YsnF